MQTLVEKYQKLEHPELELRMKLEAATWAAVFEKVSSRHSAGAVSQIISVSGAEGQRREMNFEAGKKTYEMTIRKLPVAHQFIGGIKIALNTETPIQPGTFDSSAIKQIRFKIRASVLPLEHWRLDFTCARTLTEQFQFRELADYKMQIFGDKPLRFQQFLIATSAIAKQPQISYEIELEYLPNIPLSIEELNRGLEYLRCLIPAPSIPQDLELSQVLRDLSITLWPTSHGPAPTNLRQIVPQPTGLSRHDWCAILWPEIDQYWVTDKADGERCLVWFREQQICWLITAKQAIAIEVDSPLTETIFDAEVIGIENAKPKRIYLFDLLLSSGRLMVDQSLSDRITELDRLTPNLPPIMQKKSMVQLVGEIATNQIAEIYQRTRLYPVDGLIFTPNAPYFGVAIYKWKPPEHLTIDFLVIRSPKKKPRMFLLFVGISAQMAESLRLEKIRGYDQIFPASDPLVTSNYFPIQFTMPGDVRLYQYQQPANDQRDIDHRVAEFSRDLNTGRWVLHRVRPDKSMGNDYRVATATYRMIEDPLLYEHLMDPVAACNQQTKRGSTEDVESYFSSAKSAIYKPITKLHAFIKSRLLRQLSGMDWVVDLASGKGQDLFTYNGFGIRHLVCVDQDAVALAELDRRRNNLHDDSYYLYAPRPNTDAVITTCQQDLTAPANEILNHIIDCAKMAKANAVVINFAIHYLIHDVASLNNFVELVDALLNPGGIFIFTCFNAAKIKKLLSPLKKGESWTANSPDGTAKYGIQRLYSEAESTAPFGLQIAVIHPFSSGQYYPEYLVSIPAIISAFSKKNYLPRQNSSFATWLTDFGKFNPKISALLTEEDIFYDSLYQYVSLWKANNK